MLVLAVAGIGLLLGAPVIAGGLASERRDPVAVRRILQLIGVILIVGALFATPYNPETTAIPPRPGAEGGGSVDR